ncbi:hypothetical protein Hanom_Chr09g00814051 [Helianthus anomalus]
MYPKFSLKNYDPTRKCVNKWRRRRNLHTDFLIRGTHLLTNDTYVCLVMFNFQGEELENFINRFWRAFRIVSLI